MVSLLFEIGIVYLFVNSLSNIEVENICLVQTIPVLITILFPLLLLVFIFMICIDLQCWNFVGKEIICFGDDNMVISQKGRIMKTHSVIKYDEIESIVFENSKIGYSFFSFNALYLFGWKSGCIKIKMKDGGLCFLGQSLTAPEAKRNVIPKIKEIILEKSGIQL